MRLKKAIRIAQLILVLPGIALILASVFAFQLGLDNDPGWGRGRLVMLVLGILSLLGIVILAVYNPLVRLWYAVKVSLSALWAGFTQLSAVRAVCRAWRAVQRNCLRIPLVAWFHRSGLRRAYLAAGLAAGLCIFFYLFFFTSGTFSRWWPVSSYFNGQADAFLAGQIALLETPTADLLALENPYLVENRDGVHFMWDATLFDGKYYLYWGVFPSLVATLVKVFFPVVVEDQYLIFFFLSLFVIVFALLLVLLREKLFPKSPARFIAAFTLLGGFSLPLVWLVAHPRVYEAAISAAQCGLFVGLYAVLRAYWSEKRAPAWLLLAGFAWGAAVNSRLSIFFAIGWLILAIAWLFKRKFGWKGLLQRSVYILIPLLCWAGLLFAYNYLRFGSVFETGHRYQLTGYALPENYSDVTSISYIIPSVYGYFLRPYQFNLSDFPFFHITFITQYMWPNWIRLPDFYYYPERVVGLFPGVPGVLLVFAPLFIWLRRGWYWLNESRISSDCSGEKESTPLLWIFLVAAGLLIAPLLIFISTSMRYLADVVPMLALAAALASGWVWQRLEGQSGKRFGLGVLIWVLILLGFLISFLINFFYPDREFFEVNRPLFLAVRAFFGD
jgi:hypothetical protein